MAHKISRRTALGMMASASAYGVLNTIPIPEAHAAANSFKILVNLELLGGMDQHTLWLPRAATPFSALADKRPEALFAESPADGLDIGTSLVLHPRTQNFLSRHLANTRLILNMSNRLRQGHVASHELAQNVMTTGSAESGGALRGWKARLFVNDSNAELMGFAGSKGANYNCDRNASRCTDAPPLVLDTFETFRFDGVSFVNQLGGRNNSTHVASILKRMAEVTISEDEGPAAVRSALRGTLSSLEDVQVTVDEYATPLAAAYPSGSFAARLRNIASLARRMSTEGRTDKLVIGMGLGGWDFHDGWVTRANNLIGTLFDGLDIFLSDLKAMNLADNVVLFTATDFGRKHFSNGSGTDHGHAYTSLVIGGKVRGGAANIVYGDIPSASNFSTLSVPVPQFDQRALVSYLLQHHMNLDWRKAFPEPLASEFDQHNFGLFT